MGALIGGRYQLVRGIGAGGMGEVWEATHQVTGKHVAIKILNATYAKQPSVRARFLLEARAACRVRHPNVVQVHDVLELADGAPAMVMDFLQGEALSAKLERDRLIAIGPLATILAPVVDAMQAAHALGIVHRDLKPDNLFLERLPSGEIVVKVLDFGIAKVARGEDERDNPALTGTGAVLGTPYYMSPEQMFGEKDLDHRSDVWSLGIILYECLTGRRPTEAENFGQILKLITTGSIPPLHSVAPQVPLDVAELVGRMVTRDRTLRPELSEVLEVLRRYSSSSVSTSVPALRIISTATAANVATLHELDQTAPACETVAAAPALPLHSSRALRWGAAAAAACVFALAGVGFMRARSSGEADAASASGLVATVSAAHASDHATASAPPPETATLPSITKLPAAPSIVAEPVPPVVRPAIMVVPKRTAPAAPLASSLEAPAAAPAAAPPAAVPTTPASGVGNLHPVVPF